MGDESAAPSACGSPLKWLRHSRKQSVPLETARPLLHLTYSGLAHHQQQEHEHEHDTDRHPECGHEEECEQEHNRDGMGDGGQEQEMECHIHCHPMKDKIDQDPKHEAKGLVNASQLELQAELQKAKALIHALQKERCNMLSTMAHYVEQLNNVREEKEAEMNEKKKLLEERRTGLEEFERVWAQQDVERVEKEQCLSELASLRRQNKVIIQKQELIMQEVEMHIQKLQNEWELREAALVEREKLITDMRQSLQHDWVSGAKRQRAEIQRQATPEKQGHDKLPKNSKRYLKPNAKLRNMTEKRLRRKLLCLRRPHTLHELNKVRWRQEHNIALE